MRPTQIILSAACSLFCLGSAYAQSTPKSQSAPAATGSNFQSVETGEALTPGQEFSNTVMFVRSPKEPGWKMGAQSSVALSFLKPGAKAHEHEAAQVMLFPMKDDMNKEEFQAFIKKGIEADTPPERFRPIESRLVYTAERGYPCVSYSGLTEDKGGSEGKTMRLQVRSLYCHHPRDKGVGFMVAYMHVGTGEDKNLPAKADAFFKGVKAVVVTSTAASGTRESDPDHK